MSSIAITTAEATEESFSPPDAWQDVGPVEKWREMDSHFLRIEGVEGSPEPSSFNFEQKSIYKATSRHRSELPLIDLATFKTLDPEKQAARQQRSRRELKYVKDYRLRVAGLVMNIKSQSHVGWGDSKADHRSIGDILGRLHTAVGLDPSNVYAWHLLAYLSANCGDGLRALNALDGCDEALDMHPVPVLTDVRRQVALDRAWILRDMGYFSQAAMVLDELVVDNTHEREAYLLRGLIAAQTGDMKRAIEIANDFQGTRVHAFPLDWEVKGGLRAAIYDPQTWSTRPSDHLKCWILALAWLREGNTEHTYKAFPEFNLDRHYDIGHRFLNEAAQIYEITGRNELATRFWTMAHNYVPFLPSMVYKTYGANLRPITYRSGAVPFILAFDSHLITGSRLGYGMALVNQALHEEDRDEQVDLANRAVFELEICLRSGMDTGAAALALGYAHAILGNSFEIVRAADTAQAAIERPGQDQARLAAVQRLRTIAEQAPDQHGTAPYSDLYGLPGETTEETKSRLRAAYETADDKDSARRDLARFMIRFEDPEAAAALVEIPFADGGAPTAEDWILILELDRVRKDTTRIVHLLDALKSGQAGRWPEARLWLTVGVTCQEFGIQGGRLALEHALELDPDNTALQNQLLLTGP
jgi:tetratricopeptide (TPR) repeat protein